MTNYETRLLAIAQALAHLRQEAQRLRQQMQTLKTRAVAHAAIHMACDRRGNRTIMRLLHRADSPSAPGTLRRREYIGQDPQRQAEARRRVGLWAEYAGLRGELKGIEGRIGAAEAEIERLEEIVN